VTVGEVMRLTRKILSANPVIASRGTADAETERIMAHVLACGGLEPSRLELFSGASRAIAEESAERAFSVARSRAGGRPLQHLIGSQVFLDHEYEVGPEVLVPRPETELLAMRAIEHLSSRGEATGPGLEIGIGSGVLSIELLARFPGLTMIASEVEAAARAVASRNARRILGPGPGGVGRLTIREVSDSEAVCAPLAAALGGAQASFLVSNPPYLSPTDPLDPDVVEFEPKAALFPPGGDPMHFYRGIAREADPLILPGTPVILELPHARAREIARLFESEGWDVVVFPDLNGLDRVLEARKGGRNG